MKRFHIHVGVLNLDESVKFYSNLFGQAPTKLKTDYAKWMLEDPRINFAISNRSNSVGLDHLGLQVDEGSELVALTEQLKNANMSLFDEGSATCCYAESTKAWVKDPSGIAWEAYHTMADAEVFNEKPKSACCAPSNDKSKSSCC